MRPKSGYDGSNAVYGIVFPNYVYGYPFQQNQKQKNVIVTAVGECNRAGSQPHDETRICIGDSHYHVTCGWDEGSPYAMLHPTDDYWFAYAMNAKGSV